MSALFAKKGIHPVTGERDLRTKWSLRWQKFLETVLFNHRFSHWLAYHISWKTGKAVLYPTTGLYFSASAFNAIRPIIPIPRWVAKLVKFQDFMSKRGEL